MISSIFHFIFFEPLYNLLVFLVNILPYHSLGLAIIILTVVVRLVIFPFSHRSAMTQRKMKEIEPEIKKIKEKFKDKREEQTRQIMALYKAHGISPFSSFLMLLIQLPIFIALFMILKTASEINADLLYSFVSAPESINTFFLGFIELSRSSVYLAVAAGISQFFQIKMSLPESQPKEKQSNKPDFQRIMNMQMKYVMPIFIFIFAQKFASGLALYWTTSNLFGILHEIIVKNKVKETNAVDQQRRDKFN